MRFIIAVKLTRQP